MVIGSVVGAGVSSIDAYLGGRDIGEAAIIGGVLGAITGPLGAIRCLQPILVGIGLGLSAIGTFQALLEEENIQLAVFRAALGVYLLQHGGIMSTIKMWCFRYLCVIFS